MEIYIVTHEYGVDGGFGDAVYTEDIIEAFESEEDAEAFVARYQNPHVYSRPYDDLECGTLKIKTIALRHPGEEPDITGFWWLEEAEDIED